MRWIILLAGFALSLRAARIPWCSVLPKEGGYEWFYDKADPVSAAPFSIVTSGGSGAEVQSDRIIGMRICGQICSESFVFARLLRRGVALHLRSVSLLCLTLAGWREWGVFRISSVKGLLLLFCSHLKHWKASPVAQHASGNDQWLVPGSFGLDLELGPCVNTIYTSQCCKNVVSEYMTWTSPELELVPLLASICCVTFILKVLVLF